MGKRVLLLGSYGQTNLGDDLLMYNLLELLRAQGCEKIIVNVSQKDLVPAEVGDRFGDVIELHETYGTSPFDWLRLLRRVDTVVYGGGTIFKDLYSSTGRGKHSVVARIMIFNLLAKLMGKRVLHIFIGIGSIRTRLGRFLTKVSLNAAAHTYFRDQESYVYALQTLKVKSGKMTLATDGIFLNTDWGERETYHRLAAKGETRKLVGVNALSDIPDWIDRKAYIAEMQALLLALTKQQVLLVFIPFQTEFNPHNDLTFIGRELSGGLPKGSFMMCDKTSLADLRPIFSQLDYFIGMRFHSLLVSAIFGVPFLALEYDTKCTRLIEEMKYPYSLPLDKLTAREALDEFSGLRGSDAEDIEWLQGKYVTDQTQRMDDVVKQLEL